MSVFAGSSFITTFNAEVSDAFQRRSALLRNTVRVQNNVVGSTYKFPVIGKFGTQKNKARHADVDLQNVTHSQVTATLDNYHSADMIEDLDQFKTNIQFRDAYTRNISSALARVQDDIILAAVNAGSTSALSTNGDAAQTMTTLDPIAEAAAILKAQDVDFESGDVTLVISPAVERKLMTIAQFASSDYVNSSPTETGTENRLFGMKVVVHSALAVAANSTNTCLAYAKDAVGLAIGKDLVTDIERVPEKDGWLVMGKLSMGAVSILPSGIARMKITA